MEKIKSKKKVIVTHPYLRSSSNTGDLKSTVRSNTGLSRETWTESKSDTLRFTKSANSPSPATYIVQNKTPQDITSLSQESMGEKQNNIKTIHHSSNVYRNLDHNGPMVMMSTPSMSMSVMESMMNGLDKDLMDINTIICESLNEGSMPTARTTVRDEEQGDFEYGATKLDAIVKENLEEFFMATSSKSLADNSEDWGIDRSVNTLYSRSGFFADCSSADKVFHGEYLSTWGMHSFAECRMPLIFCIILTDREVRKYPGYSPVASLAINLLDRFMASQSDCLTKIVHLVYNQLKTYKHERTSRKSSLSTKDTVSSIDSQESGKSINKSSDKSIKSNKSNKSSDKKNGKLSGRQSAKSAKKVAKVNSKSARQTKKKAEDPITNGVKSDDEPEERLNGFDSDDVDKESMIVNMEVVYNLVALACYFIADRYHGLINVTPKTLMAQWAYTCRIFKKTRYGAYYISKNRHASLHAATCAMFEIYSALDYAVTVPSVPQMVQSLIESSSDIPRSQNPAEKNVYQNAGYVLGRIAIMDDTFHRFRASVLALSVYSLIRKVAAKDRALLQGACAWLEVDESDAEIEECKELLVKTLSQFLNSDVLDAVTQPLSVKWREDDIFTATLLGDTTNMSLRAIKRVAAVLSR